MRGQIQSGGYEYQGYTYGQETAAAERRDAAARYNYVCVDAPAGEIRAPSGTTFSDTNDKGEAAGEGRKWVTYTQKEYSPSTGYQGYDQYNSGTMVTYYIKVNPAYFVIPPKPAAPTDDVYSWCLVGLDDRSLLKKYNTDDATSVKPWWNWTPLNYKNRAAALTRKSVNFPYTMPVGGFKWVFTDSNSNIMEPLSAENSTFLSWVETKEKRNAAAAEEKRLKEEEEYRKQIDNALRESVNTNLSQQSRLGDDTIWRLADATNFQTEKRKLLADRGFGLPWLRTSQQSWIDAKKHRIEQRRVSEENRTINTNYNNAVEIQNYLNALDERLKNPTNTKSKITRFGIGTGLNKDERDRVAALRNVLDSRLKGIMNKGEEIKADPTILASEFRALYDAVKGIATTRSFARLQRITDGKFIDSQGDRILWPYDILSILKLGQQSGGVRRSRRPTRRRRGRRSGTRRRRS